ncbi:MAG: hypothetical protein OEV44_09035, partial [Spirochaetota bacterium]|nr:hypothetical protein [Spirochaetota bacterium]
MLQELKRANYKNQFIFLLLFIILFSSSIISCKKRYPRNSIGANPKSEVGTIVFKIDVKKTLTHSVLSDNNEIKKGLNLLTKRKFTPFNIMDFIKNIDSISGIYTSTNGNEKLMVRLDGDFKDLSFNNILTNLEYKKSQFRGLKSSDTYYKSEDIDSPSIIVSKNHIFVSYKKHMLEVYKKLNSKSWISIIDKEFSSNFIKKTLGKSVFLLSYTLPDEPKRNAHNEITKNLDKIPFYFPILSFKKIYAGIGEDNKKLTYFASF